jgi:hypothetical protein
MAEIGVLPQKNATINFPAPTANLSGKFSKSGTTRNHLFLSDVVGDPPALQVIDIHTDDDVKYNTKGLDECDPASITGLAPEQARATCPKAEIGRGSSQVIGLAEEGLVTLFNGTKQNGNPTVLFHTFTANVPIVLVSEIQNSPLPGYDKVFHTPVSTAAGGQVPPGIVIGDTDYTISRNYKDKKLLKKAKKAKKKGNTKKAKKLKKKAKKSWIQVRCTQGVLRSQVDFIHVPPDPSQTVTGTQACTS